MRRDASTTVFRIPELAENIFLRLGTAGPTSWKELYPLQRVNSTFQAIIQHSPALKRCMHLEHANSRTHALEFSDTLDSMRQFFSSMDDILYPFWCHLRPQNAPSTMVLALNISLFWTEDLPGTYTGKAPGPLNGSTPIEQHGSWRKILVPHHPQHALELHCCGYDVMTNFDKTTTLGELADEAIKAGKIHLEALGSVLYHGQESYELDL